jgi:protein TonB
VGSLLVHAAGAAACFIFFVWCLDADQKAQFSFHRGVTSIEVAFVPPEEESAPEPIQIIVQPKPEAPTEPLLETKPTPRSRGIDLPAIEMSSPMASGSTTEQQPPVIVALPLVARVEKPIQNQKTVVKRSERQKKRFGQEAAVASHGVANEYVFAGPRTFEPEHPPEMLRRKVGGSLMLELHIAADGKVTRVVLIQSSGYPLYDQEAINTAFKWHGTPARSAGVPVESIVFVPVVFKTPL